MKQAKRAGDFCGRHRRCAWSRVALIGAAVGLLAARVAMAQDDIASPLPVGTTVDLSVATVGPIRDVAVADQTYVAVEDQGLWVLQADGKTIEKVSGPLEGLTGVATDGGTYYLVTDDGLFAGHAPTWNRVISDMITAMCVQLDQPLYLAGAAHGMWRSVDGASVESCRNRPQRSRGALTRRAPREPGRGIPMRTLEVYLLGLLVCAAPAHAAGESGQAWLGAQAAPNPTPRYHSTNVGEVQITEADTQFRMPSAGNLLNLVVNCQGSPGSGKTFTWLAQITPHGGGSVHGTVGCPISNSDTQCCVIA